MCCRRRPRRGCRCLQPIRRGEKHAYHTCNRHPYPRRSPLGRLGVGSENWGQLLSARKCGGSLSFRATEAPPNDRTRQHSHIANPSWRASSVGVYRLWRDLGYAIGALVAGLSADLLGLAGALWVVAALTAASGAIVALRMSEPHPS